MNCKLFTGQLVDGIFTSFECFYVIDSSFCELPCFISVENVKIIEIKRTKFLSSFKNTTITATGISDHVLVERTCFSNCTIISSNQDLNGCNIRLVDSNAIASHRISETSFIGCVGPFSDKLERYVVYLNGEEAFFDHSNSSFNKLRVGPGVNFNSKTASLSFSTFIGSFFYRSVFYFLIIDETKTQEMKHVVVAKNQMSLTSIDDGALINIYYGNIKFCNSFFIDNISPCLVYNADPSFFASFESSEFSTPKTNIENKGSVSFDIRCAFGSGSNRWLHGFQNAIEFGCLAKALPTKNTTKHLRIVCLFFVLNCTCLSK